MTDRGPDERYVVLGDVVDSREIDDREAFGSRLETAFERINGSEAENMATPLTRMKGIDEFGCVLSSPSPVPDVVSGILDRVHPVRARFAVASGAIDVGPDRETVARMDGPAFHRANALLEAAERDGLYVGVDTGRAADGLVETALNLLLLEREGLTDRQMEVIRAYERHGTQSRAGEAVGLGQQGVSNALQRANYRRRTTLRSHLRRAIEAAYG